MQRIYAHVPATEDISRSVLNVPEESPSARILALAKRLENPWSSQTPAFFEPIHGRSFAELS